MSIDILILLFVLIFLIYALYREIFHPAATFMIAVSILVIAGILEPSEALAGFSNEQIVIIVLLLLVSSIVQKTKIIDFYFSKILKEELSYRSFLGKMMLIVSSASAFLNNTPIVAMLIPYVYEWGRKKDIAPSKLLIPLSYAAILGGTVTLIGTSTNLVVNGLTVDNGLKAFDIFDFAYVGVPAVIAGFLYMMVLGNRLLPSREDLLKSYLQRKKEYTVETIVKADSELIGKSIKEAKLRNLKGLFLVEIVRKDKNIYPVSPEEVLEKGDILIFAGETEAITDLISSNIGLSLPETCNIREEISQIVEVVVSNNSSLVNKKVRDTDFRAKYDAAILAVHRNGEKLKGKIGEIVLKPGDLLLLLTGKDFMKRAEDTTDFYIVSKVKDVVNIDKKKGSLILFSFIGIVILSTLKVISLFSGLLIFLAALVMTKTITYAEVKRSLDINLIIIAAFSIAIGKAMLDTGTADLIASSINEISSGFGVVGALAGIYIITNILTEFITNIAAASIAFPIALASASSLSVEPTAFILAVAYGASASFISPIGYQTNLMVFGVGNYKFSDFLKVGLPLSLIYMVICITILSVIFL